MHPLARMLLLRSLPLALLLGAAVLAFNRLAVAVINSGAVGGGDGSVTVDDPGPDWFGIGRFVVGGFLVLAVMEGGIFLARRGKPPAG